MNNLDYITTILGKFGVSPDEIIILLQRQGIDPNGEVDGAESYKTLDTAIYYQLPFMFAGMQDVSEGGYSIKWNLDGIKLWFSWLAKQLGLPDTLTPKPVIKGKKPW